MKKLLPSSSFMMFVVLLIVCLAGCVGLTKAQQNGVSGFGKAAAALGTVSKEQFQGGRETVIQMKEKQLAIEKKVLSAKQADRASCEEELNLDSGLDQENIASRVKAADLLVQYGNLLAAFVDNTQGKDLASATNAFTDSVKDFPGNTLTSDELKGLGQLIIMAGEKWISNEKKDALKKIIPQVSPLISKVCDSLQKDFDWNRKGILADIFNTQDRLASAAIDGLKREGGSINDRLLLIESFELANKNKLAVETSSAKLLKAIESLRKADKNLAAIINDDNNFSTGDIDSFVEDVNALVKAIKPFLK
ncbi:MAG: hypothetical protein CVU55_03780 [Deltaproteobacteria bacterium HGW-Deltaproteobacteria-13]|jgi:hypothetical protein|nr:MAG: hypothetical protein CVU55_03780 [Deltaproteobacteria bacterium HGW-Deltaproteobacteria-13]